MWTEWRRAPPITIADIPQGVISSFEYTPVSWFSRKKIAAGWGNQGKA
jgi:hypothetical protein